MIKQFLPQGAELTPEGVRYRTWAPKHQEAVVEIERGGKSVSHRMQPTGDGHFEWTDAAGGAGDLYSYQLNGGGPFPDPASRWQPEGVHGRSMVIDPRSYHWQDSSWQRPPFRDFVAYEIHIGTFTEAGTFRAAIERLPYLRELGVTAIQIMPVADFPGAANWGYDGVSLYAPARCYGAPDDLRALVDAAHRQGIAVVLDAVYNHFGPDGNYLSAYSAHYFTNAHKTPWGDAFNFDGERHEPVRAFFVANAAYWIDEFHVDCLRLDATHAMIDDSPKHILAEIAEAVHARGAYLFAEDERNSAKVIEPAPLGHDMNGVYADDFCHTVQVALGDRSYDEDFNGGAEELASELGHGWHYRGQHSAHHGKGRGSECAHVPPERFMFCITNHDQVGNRAFGERLHVLTTPEAYRAASAALLLAPETPMLFMGQEWAASTPFQYFTDHNAELGRLVSEGRRKEFARFAEFRDPAVAKTIPDPQSRHTFLRSKLQWNELEQPAHASTLALYRELLHLRKAEAALRPATRDGWSAACLHGIVAVRYRGAGEWLVLVDLTGGNQLTLSQEEFTKPAGGQRWQLVLSSNEPRFGGTLASRAGDNVEAVLFRIPEVLVLKSTL